MDRIFQLIIPLSLLVLITLLSFTKKDAEKNNESQVPAKPNIIFLLTDDQRWDALGAMGNTIIQTPNMNKLAGAGILFENAYVTTSICCVSRASLLTGQYESAHQIYDFSTDLSPEALAKTYPVLLKNAGYKLGFAGKFGVGHHPPASIFDFWVDTEAGGKGQPDYLMTGKDGNKIHDTDTLGNAIQDFLNRFGKGDDPFCLSVSFKAPHEQDGHPPKYVIQPKYKDYYKDVIIPYPVTAAPKYWEQLPDFFSTDTNFGRERWKGLFGTPELYQENVKNYYRLITGVDNVVGNMMKKLSELGIDKNTIIIIMGDNGMAGVPAPKQMQGVNLISLLENKLPERKDFFYQHYFLGGPRIPRVEGVVTKNFKYMNYIEHNYEEVYDIKHDPHETTNLATNPKYKMKLDELRKRYKELKKIHGVPLNKLAKVKTKF